MIAALGLKRYSKPQFAHQRARPDAGGDHDLFTFKPPLIGQYGLDFIAAALKILHLCLDKLSPHMGKYRCQFGDIAKRI